MQPQDLCLPWILYKDRGLEKGSVSGRRGQRKWCRVGGGDHSREAGCLLTHQLCDPGQVTWPSCALVSSPINGGDPSTQPSGLLGGLHASV